MGLTALFKGYESSESLSWFDRLMIDDESFQAWDNQKELSQTIRDRQLAEAKITPDQYADYTRQANLPVIVPEADFMEPYSDIFTATLSLAQNTTESIASYGKDTLTSVARAASSGLADVGESMVETAGEVKKGLFWATIFVVIAFFLYIILSSGVLKK